MNENEIIIYQTEDGVTKISVTLDGDTVWLTQAQMAELFQTTPQNITLHIGNIYQEGELTPDSTCKEFLQVQPEGGREVKRKRKYYNLDVIISVGYRVKSLRGTQFRIWANGVLKDYLIKGFALDDETTILTASSPSDSLRSCRTSSTMRRTGIPPQKSSTNAQTPRNPLWGSRAFPEISLRSKTSALPKTI